MKEHLGDRDLWNRLTGSFEQASIFHGLNDKNFRDFETVWKPELERRAKEFATWGERAEGNVQDVHWDWVGKAQNEAVFESYAIECDDMTQALMLVATAPHFGRLESQRGLDLSYIELLASAPWNRPKFSETPKYKGGGRILLATAISLSIELELKGRIGLHSLPESESWYDEQGMKRCGFDADKKMQYFEMTEEDAEKYLKS
jgi:hypothetical protein